MIWISIKDRLPDDNQMIIAFSDEWNEIVYGKFHNFKDVQKFEECEGYTPNISHWMPLPEPPKTPIENIRYENKPHTLVIFLDGGLAIFDKEITKEEMLLIEKSKGDAKFINYDYHPSPFEYYSEYNKLHPNNPFPLLH